MTLNCVNRLLSLLKNQLEYLTSIITNGDIDVADKNVCRDFLCNFVKDPAG